MVPRAGGLIQTGHFEKVGSPLVLSTFKKVAAVNHATVATLLSRREERYFIFYQEATQYWVKATIGLPHYSKNGTIGAPPHGRYLYFREARDTHVVCAVLHSSLFYNYFIAYGDCFHLSDKLVSTFPMPESVRRDDRLVSLGVRLMTDLMRNAENKTINTSTGDRITYAEFYASRSKSIIDAIDVALARHYGFTDEELDFIVNYDIKYPMGRDAENTDGDGQ